LQKTKKRRKKLEKVFADLEISFIFAPSLKTGIRSRKIAKKVF